MMRACRVAVFACGIGGLLGAAAPLGGQGGGGGGDDAAAVAQGRSGAATERRVTLDLRDVELREALREIAAQSGVSLAYDNRTVPLDRRVSLRVTNATAVEALRTLLRGTGVAVQPSGGRVLLVRRADQSPPALLPPDGALSGRVTDAATGAPVPGAVVVVDGGRLRATATAQGEYRLSAVPAGVRVLTARRIGYAPAEQSVTVPEGGAVTLDFALGAVASRLDEVVTTVTGAQRRLEVGNAIGRIAADSLVGRAPITSFTDLVNARVPGVQVVTNDGFTGSTARIRIRGINSLTVSNDPLLVVDGVRVENSTSTVGTSYGMTPGRMNDLNPEEIESIEVVKGPSAATLYGTDAANGVIVVRTKRGRAGEARWSAYAEGGVIDGDADFPDSWYSWGRSTATNAVQQCLLTQAAAGGCVIDSLTTFNPMLYPETSPLGTGTRGQYGLQLAGGVTRFSYFLAGEYEHETGFLRMPAIDVERVRAERGGAAIPEEQLRPNALRRLSMRGNAGATIGDDAEVNVSLGIVRSDVRMIGNALHSAGIGGWGYRNAEDGWRGIRPGEAFGLRNAEEVTHYTTSLNASWRPLPWLTTRGTVGVDYSSAFLDALQRRGEGPTGANRNGRRQNTKTDIGQYTVDLGASALFSPRPALSSRTSVGVQYNRRALQASTVSGTNLSPGSETIAGAAVVTGSEQNVETVVAGAYLEQTLGYRERLFVTGALRADGASAFGRDFSTALYPKASASWLVTAAPVGLLHSARLRLAYGASGVQPAPTASLQLVQLAPALVGGAPTTGARVTAIGNPDLRPERQTELETGADVELFGGRGRVELTYYDRLSRDALINRPIAPEIGIATRQENIGSVRNRGVEALLGATLLDTRAVGWELTLNGSANRNRLERIGADVPFIGAPTIRSQEGYPLFSIFARPILGYADANGNGIIETSEVQVGDSAVFAGTRYPTRQATLTNTVRLLGQRLSISTQLDYRGGFRKEHLTELNRCLSRVACRGVNDPAAPFSEQAAAVALRSPSLGSTFDGFITDASFVRWRELTVSYALPDALASSMRARGATVTLTGRNLALFTRWPGFDPEIVSAPGFLGSEGYLDNPTAPPARYWTARINLNF